MAESEEANSSPVSLIKSTDLAPDAFLIAFRYSCSFSQQIPGVVISHSIYLLSCADLDIPIISFSSLANHLPSKATFCFPMA